MSLVPDETNDPAALALERHLSHPIFDSLDPETTQFDFVNVEPFKQECQRLRQCLVESASEPHVSGASFSEAMLCIYRMLGMAAERLESNRSVETEHTMESSHDP